jgi:hypothetical protein
MPLGRAFEENKQGQPPISGAIDEGGAAYIIGLTNSTLDLTVALWARLEIASASYIPQIANRKYKARRFAVKCVQF